MKFLVLGATGMAGHTISLFLHENGHEVTTFSRKPFLYCENINGDIINNPLFKDIMLKNYDVVINCIGVLNEACDSEPSSAVYLNSYLPHLIVQVLENSHTRLIHMSTDCVFSGKSAPYSEKSFRDGETFYDRTKGLGEIDDNKNLTFRNSIIGPDMNKNGIGLFNWFMKQEGTINGYQHAIWNGVTTLTLAKAIERAAIEKVTGLYHLVNNTSISKYDLLKIFNNKFKENKINILPDESVKVDKTLINNRKDLSFVVPSYEQMIHEMKEWIYNHRNLYPHYFSRENS
ncbi:sugar nucleotide-binding protein [Metabacillus halosaccharovorans]|uniref:dTDP-4-dehydrorhamnose reductase n=1 Tax=Metabacillus halosaccharovorans TaxID=930124 RepID=A0ABT3DFJ6_9BACI|nr:sugar nucleotide-binding protein [Metabacillus halosaccharovorans]MCV9885432.1 sugar nucleotide-binding protein [Metabacillus halosaccharovorans]